MKKQIKNCLKFQARTDMKAQKKYQGIAKVEEKIKSKPNHKQAIINNSSFLSPNKQNLFSSANHRTSLGIALSPAANPGCNTFLSPTKVGAQDILQCLKSNKSKEVIQKDSNQTDNQLILYSGLSKDGKYKVQSKILQGDHLAKAVEQQRKNTINSIVLAAKDKSFQKIPTLEPAKTSNRQNGLIKGYAVNTHQGISRNYNEDRVSITLNIKKKGVRSHFFALYDGHGGSRCCDFLRDNLHEQLIKHSDFPEDPKKALSEAILKCESHLLQSFKLQKLKEGQVDKSGSCALIALLVDDYCYVANVGDSRAMLSTQRGKLAFNLSRDHRPTDIKEQQRIFQKGGKIYRTQMIKIDQSNQDKDAPQTVTGPLRIHPGKLSVSRTIGDIEAKDMNQGGIKQVISAQPQIRKFKLSLKEDFILLCCDGILEKMQSKEVVETAWKAIKGTSNIHEALGRGVDAVIKQGMRRRSTDNMTAIIIGLQNLNKDKLSNKETYLRSA